MYLFVYKFLKLNVFVTFAWRRKWQPTPLFLPGKSHGQRSPVGYSPQGCKESNMTERLKSNNIGRDCLVYWLLEKWWLFYILIYVSFTDDGLLACILQYSWNILLVSIVNAFSLWVHSSIADLENYVVSKKLFLSYSSFSHLFSIVNNQLWLVNY